MAEKESHLPIPVICEGAKPYHTTTIDWSVRTASLARDLHKIRVNEVDWSSGFHVKVGEINNYVEVLMY